MRVDENGCDRKDIFGWIGVAVVLVALTALSVCTLGAAAPISGIAATMVVGETIGVFIGTGASIISPGIHNGWNNISGFQVFRECIEVPWQERFLRFQQVVDCWVM